MQAQLNKVVVKPLIEEGEVLQATGIPPSVKGEVISKGPTNKCDIEEGDTILFSGHAGVRFEEEKEKYLVLQEAEVLVKL